MLSTDHDAARDYVVGRARGSGRQIYQCMVQLGQQADGSLKVAGQCACPVDYNCKHVAAVLRSVSARFESDRPGAVLLPMSPP